MAKPLTSWLVPSFSQHNLRLVVSERCLHVSVIKFWHKFASLRQVNTPSSWDKFQNCCTDMYLIRFLPNLAVFCVFLWISQDFADLPEPREISEALILTRCMSSLKAKLLRPPGLTPSIIIPFLVNELNFNRFFFFCDIYPKQMGCWWMGASSI